MKVYARQGTLGYAVDIGIVVTDGLYQCIPGDVRNHTTFSFPVVYKATKGINKIQITANLSKLYSIERRKR